MLFFKNYANIVLCKEEGMDFSIDASIDQAKILTNKLKILFLLEKMEIPLTENNILDICTRKSNEWLKIGYMDCKEILWQLQESGFIYITDNQNEEKRYTLTYEGRSCLSHFYLRIPQSIREKITTFAKENRMNMKRQQEYVSEYFKNEDGSHTVLLKIKEPLVPQSLLEIKLKAPTRQIAIDACKKWNDNAPNVFEYLYDNLIDN